MNSYVFKLFSFFLKDEIVYSEPGENLPLPELVSLPGGEDYHSAFLKMIFSLLFFLAFAGFSLWFLKRVMQKKRSSHPTKSMQLIEKKALSPKSCVYLMDVEGKKVLISESQLDMRITPLEEKKEEPIYQEEKLPSFEEKEEEALV